MHVRDIRAKTHAAAYKCTPLLARLPVSWLLSSGKDNSLVGSGTLTGLQTGLQREEDRDWEEGREGKFRKGGVCVCVEKRDDITFTHTHACMHVHAHPQACLRARSCTPTCVRAGVHACCLPRTTFPPRVKGQQDAHLCPPADQSRGRNGSTYASRVRARAGSDVQRVRARAGSCVRSSSRV